MSNGEQKKKCNFDRIKFVRDYDPNLPEVPCISSEIEQVMRNLIRNAAQAILDQEESTAKPKGNHPHQT